MKAKEKRQIGNVIVAIKEAIEKSDLRIESLEGAPPKKPIRKLVRFFKSVKDPRSERMVEYPLHEIIMSAFLAIMSGAATYIDIGDFAATHNAWLSRNFGVKHGAPSHDTFRRVLSLLDPATLQTATVAFTLETMKLVKREFKIKDAACKQLCVDGKASRGTGRLKGSPRETKQLQTLHVYDRTDGVCIASARIDDKTNEIPVAQSILKLMDLRGAIVSFDAQNTQRETAKVIVGQKGDYVGALKGNQRGLFEDAKAYFSPALLARIKAGGANYRETKEKLHNRIETRRYYLSKNVGWFMQAESWEGIRSLVCYTLHTEDIPTGKTTDETRCYISTLTDVALCASAIRGHWSVENQLHWHLDANFNEDGIAIADKAAAMNISLLSKMALSILKLAAPLMKKSIRRAKKNIGWNPGILLDVFRALDEGVLSDAMEKAAEKKRKTSASV